MNMIQRMKEKAIKITVVFMAALLCLFTMPGVAMAVEGGTWVPFVNDGYFNPGTLVYSYDDSGYSVYGCEYLPSDEIEYSLTFSDVNRYRFKFVYAGIDYGWVYASSSVENIDGYPAYIFFINDNGIAAFLMISAFDGSTLRCQVRTESGVLGESFDLYIESFIPNTPSVTSFLDSGTSVLSWLISTFTSILTFMIANPICFIGLIGSLVGVAFIYIKSTIGT